MMDYSTQPQDLSNTSRHDDYSSDEDLDSEDSSGSDSKRGRFEDNNNIEGYDLTSKREFLASLELERSPEAEEEQDCFAEEFRRMKAKGEFSCRLCTAVFPNLRALKSHNRVHLEGPGFQCNLCPFSSSERGPVIHHMRSHNGDRPFECSICKFAFTTKANCERHLRNRHSSSYNTKEASTQMELPIDLSVKKPAKPATVDPQPPVLTPPSSYLTFPPFFVPPPSLLYQNLQKELIRGLSLSGGRLVEKKEEVKMVIKNGILVPKQKQRRYRTERPFGCEHCQARFTLRSNMERHIKQQHPEYWSQRQRGGGRKREKSHIITNNNNNNNDNKNNADLNLAVVSPHVSIHSHSNTKEIPEDVKAAIVEQIKTKEEKREMTDLASVSRLLDAASNQNFNEYFDRQEDEEEDEEGLVASNSETSSEERYVRSSPENEPAMNKKRSAYSLAPNRVACPYCAREFPWTSSLRRHILTHTGQKPFKCPACPLLFTTKSNCDRHAVRKHGGVRKSGAVLTATLNPTVSIDTPSGKIPSDDSPSDVQTETRRRKSDDTGGGGPEVPFKCYLCDFAFPDRQEALDHLKHSHTAEYEALLAKGALDSSSEAEDMETENKDHINRKVICAFCMRRFWSAEDLRRHMRTHTGERPFSCELCSRRFTLKHSMLRHRKKHANNNISCVSATSPNNTGGRNRLIMASPHPRTTPSPPNAKSDLISNLLGIKDSSLVETMLESTATNAAKILGIEQQSK